MIEIISCSVRALCNNIIALLCRKWIHLGVGSASEYIIYYKITSAACMRMHDE